MGLNMHKMDEQTRIRRDIEAQLLLHFACEIYWEQLERGCHSGMSIRQAPGPGRMRRW